MKQLPAFVESFLENQIKSGNCKVITKGVIDNSYSELEFDSEGFTRTTLERVHIRGYIKRLLNFCKQDIIVYVNEIALDKIPYQITNNTQEINKNDREIDK